MTLPPDLAKELKDGPTPKPAPGTPPDGKSAPVAAPPGADSGAAPIEKAHAKDLQSLRDVAEQQRRRHAARDAERAAMQTLNARAQQAEARAQEAMNRLATLEQELGDPLSLLQKRGITARQIGERIVKEGTPDAQLAEAIETARKAAEETQRLRQEIAQRAEQDRAESARLGAIRQLNGVFDEHKAKLPILTQLGSERMIAEYMHTYQSVTTHPDTRMYSYTDAELLEATEARLRADAEARLEALDDETLEKALTKRKGGASVNGTAAQAAAGAGQGSNGAQSGRTGKTLTAALSSSSSGSWKPDNWAKLSDKKQNELIVARLEAGLPLD